MKNNNQEWIEAISLTETGKNTLSLAREQAKNLGHQSVGTEHLLLALTMDPTILACKILQKASISHAQVLNKIETKALNITKNKQRKNLKSTPKLRKILGYSVSLARKDGFTLAGTEHLLAAILDTPDCFAYRVLLDLNIDFTRMKKQIKQMIQAGRLDSDKKATKNDKQNTSKTPLLDALGQDLTMLATYHELDPVFERDAEIEQITEVLCRKTKNNPLLLGEPGVGKTAVVEGLAQKMALGQVPLELMERRIVGLDIGNLVAGTRYRGDLEDRVQKLITECQLDKSVILFIDEIHTLVGAGGTNEGAVDVAGLLKPALARGTIQVIGATTLDEYQKYIEKDAALERRFSTVKVQEPSKEATVKILQGLRHGLEDHHRVQITDDVLTDAVEMSVRYVNKRFLPDKALDLVDEAAAITQVKQTTKQSEKLSQLLEQLNDLEVQHWQALMQSDLKKAIQLDQQREAVQKKVDRFYERYTTQQAKPVNSDAIRQVISKWTGIPLTKLRQADKQRLLHLEGKLQKRVIGQNKATQAVANVIRRAQAGLNDPTKPMGSFMFLGSTGIGKTELAKTLADEVFNNKDALIRIDMSEYQDKIDVSRLVGAAPGYIGYEEGGQLTEKVRQNPYSVVLFDEIEKANHDVFNLLLQVLDDGILTDSKGRKVDFRNTIIIMTSNVGATAIQKDKIVGFGKDQLSQTQIVQQKIKEALKDTFQPEFLNRIDEIITFQPLALDSIRKIVRLRLQDLQERLAKQNKRLEVTPAAVTYLAKNGYSIEYGARPIRRTIEQKIETPLSELLLADDNWHTITVNFKQQKLNFVTQ